MGPSPMLSQLLTKTRKIVDCMFQLQMGSKPLQIPAQSSPGCDCDIRLQLDRRPSDPTMAIAIRHVAFANNSMGRSYGVETLGVIDTFTQCAPCGPVCRCNSSAKMDLTQPNALCQMTISTLSTSLNLIVCLEPTPMPQKE